jgi:alpha-tubulin suppressor-like RCC1 family protein
MNKDFIVVVPENGECYTFGSNQFGQLGVDANSHNNMPTLITALDKESVSMVACGDTFSVAVTNGNVTFCVILSFSSIEYYWQTFFTIIQCSM